METTLKEIDRGYAIASLEEIGKSFENRSMWLLKVNLLEGQTKVIVLG